MSTRFTAASSQYAGRSSVTIGAALTFGGYVYLHTLPAGAATAPLFTAYGAFDGFTLFVTSNGKLNIRNYAGGGSAQGSAVLSTGTWYYVWVRFPATSFDNIFVYINASTTADVTGLGSLGTPATIQLATNQVSFDTTEYADCSLDAWKGWSADRAASNATAEMAAHALVSSTSGLAAWFLDSGDVTDHFSTLNLTATNGPLVAGPNSPIDGGGSTGKPDLYYRMMRAA